MLNFKIKNVVSLKLFQIYLVFALTHNFERKRRIEGISNDYIF